VAIGDWDNTTLCTDADCAALERDFIEWVKNDGGGTKWRELAKERIRDRLLDSTPFTTLDAVSDESNVLDLIANPEELKTPAVFKTIELVCEEKSGLGSYFQRKADRYLSLFEDELPRAVRRLNVDVDESESISLDEERNVDMRSTFIRGG